MRRTEGHANEEDSDEYCQGNADLYYVSSEAWPMFSSMMIDGWLQLKPGQKLLMNEVVIPQTMHALESAGFTFSTLCFNSQARSEVEQLGCCWGGAFDAAQGDINVYERYACGHKADMTLDNVKQELLKAWIPPESNMTKFVDEHTVRRKNGVGEVW